MRNWQWLAVPLALGFFLCVVAYPFTHYADFDEVHRDDDGNLVGGFNGWKNGVLPIREIKRLNNHKTKWGSGPFGNAQPNWLVTIILVGLIAAVCSFMFGYRPKGDPRRKEAMVESILAFTALGLAIILGAAIVIYGISWKLLGRTVVSALLGIVLLWASGTSRSRRVESN